MSDGQRLSLAIESIGLDKSADELERFLDPATLHNFTEYLNDKYSLDLEPDTIDKSDIELSITQPGDGFDECDFEEMLG